ncbi:PREDICTED: myb family transcription factor EFM-like [Ipomoea nil]|uniref:myb family transcription factor EFM-like n=1 Tax=Ipomoea nil TaxID=35883 RepID=UPI0009017312|nr:PREDICTED: myb family transcription factor EFM-like [Ipomoea nil]
MGLIPAELSLDCRPAFVPRTIAEFLGGMSTIGDASERVSRIDDYVRRLEEEMRKIDAFKRELPLCMLLVNDAIVALKEEAVQCRRSRMEPVLEEFIPLKKSSDDDDEIETRREKGSREKVDWMNSVQLWSSGNHCLSSKNDLKLAIEEEENSSVTNDLLVSGKTMNPEKTSAVPRLLLDTPAREYMVIGGLSSMDYGSRAAASSTASSSVRPQYHHHHQQQQQQQTSRKQRRCWSQELQKLFVNALHQLGGPHVATPKQIRELMQVEGLTNDEVKSHLQKYRLHIRRSAHTNTSSANRFAPQSGSPQGPLGTSLTGDNNMTEEEDDDDKSGRQIPKILTLTSKNGA